MSTCVCVCVCACVCVCVCMYTGGCVEAPHAAASALCAPPSRPQTVTACTGTTSYDTDRIVRRTGRQYNCMHAYCKHYKARSTAHSCTKRAVYASSKGDNNTMTRAAVYARTAFACIVTAHDLRIVRHARMLHVCGTTQRCASKAVCVVPSMRLCDIVFIAVWCGLHSCVALSS